MKHFICKLLLNILVIKLTGLFPFQTTFSNIPSTDRYLLKREFYCGGCLLIFIM